MTAVNYLWDPVEQNIVRELDDSGNVIAQFTTEPGLYGDLLSQRRNGEDSYYHYDGQGSTVALTNSAGDVTDTYEYSSFGEVTERNGSTINPFQYIGQKQYYRDQETGEYEVRRRSLSAETGRWLAPDPLTMSLDYVYAANKPLYFLDPSGLYVWGTGSWLCFPKAKACVGLVVLHIKNILEASRRGKNCFNPSKNTMDETEACCREALTDCILKSIESDLVLGCEKTKSGKNAVTSGHCTYNKNAPRPSNKIKAPPKLKVTPDESCDACDPDVLKKSNILFNYDAIVFPEAAACSLAAPRGKFTALARITIHELLHLCVGGHMEKGEVNIFDRPDAADLADEFIANCW